MCSVADLDGNGKNEVIIGGGNNKVFVWESNGAPSRIEWGSERHDARNTGEYGNMCPPVIITNNTTWNTSRNICGNIIVRQGAKLTISAAATVTMDATSMIIVQAGAILEIDGGKIMNANLKALPQSRVELKNSGYVKLRRKGEFTIMREALFDDIDGTIDTTF